LVRQRISLHAYGSGHLALLATGTACLFVF
jgi:hypothetical protein